MSEKVRFSTAVAVCLPPVIYWSNNNAVHRLDLTDIIVFDVSTLTECSPMTRKLMVVFSLGKKSEKEVFWNTMQRTSWKTAASA